MKRQAQRSKLEVDAAVLERDVRPHAGPHPRERERGRVSEEDRMFLSAFGVCGVPLSLRRNFPQASATDRLRQWRWTRASTGLRNGDGCYRAPSPGGEGRGEGERLFPKSSPSNFGIRIS